MAGRVAIVEDEELVRELLLAILEDRGYEVSAYGTVTEAHDAFRVSAPDLLIVDVRLPDGCGLDLVGTVRTQTGKRVPAIVLSGLREERDIVRGFAAGAVDYLPKPFNRDELLARCAVHLARATAFETPNDPDVDLPEKNGLVFGRYRVKRELGRGGYGRVYLAEDSERKDELVALKVLAPLSGEQAEARLRFIRETYALASVHDPSVVAVHDVGCVQGRLYYAMQYVEGESLTSFVRKHGPLDEREARQFALGLLGALRALDDAGLLHRDVKPENVILRQGRIDSPVIIDFGLAKRRYDRGITEADVLVGTIAYLSPEVIRGKEPDRRSDLFSLGLTLRYALSGEEIFPLLQGVELMTAIATSPIPPPPVKLSREFSDFLAHLMETDADRRTPSPAIAIDELNAMSAIAPTEDRATMSETMAQAVTERAPSRIDS